MSTSKCRSTSHKSRSDDTLLTVDAIYGQNDVRRSVKSRSDDTLSVRMVYQMPFVETWRATSLPYTVKPAVNQMSSLRDCFARKPIRHDVGDTTVVIMTEFNQAKNENDNQNKGVKI